MNKHSPLPFAQFYTILNRRELQDSLETTWARGENHGNPFGLILFSIDRFKLVNGRFGHRLADAVLKQITHVVRTAIRNRGLLGRWAGDEFLCILPDALPAEIPSIAEELRAAIANTAFPVGVNLVHVTASFGSVAYPDDGNEVKALLIAADEAQYHAKQSGRNRVVAAASLTHHALRMGNILDTALREERVMPAYQPIVDLNTGNVVAEEALARIITTDGHVIAAEEFMQVASQFQLTHKIDRTVLLSAFDRYLRQLGANNPVMHFVNISGDLLRHPELFKELLDSVKGRPAGMYADTVVPFHESSAESRSTSFSPPARAWPEGLSVGKTAHILDAIRSNHTAMQSFPLVIEITERELLGSPELTRQMLAPFLDLGARLALDDFGSGYSGFQYLADLPVSFLKIDGRFIQRIAEPKVRAIVSGIQNTANELGLITLAEHVETEQQADTLRAIGIHWAQGHLYGRAQIDEEEAHARRQMSVSWAAGYYYRETPP